MGTYANGKILIRGRIQNTAPLHIGCGESDRSDMDILLDDKMNPFIPATTLLGVLRHTITSDDPSDTEQIDKFWGYTKGRDTRASTVSCSDLLLEKNGGRTIRHGIKIDNRNHLVKHKSKYDYEIIEPGACFAFNMQFSFKQDSEFVKRMAATIYQLLLSDNIRVGAKTNNGLGRIRLMGDQTEIYVFDFKEKKDVCAWLLQTFDVAKRVSAKDLGEPLVSGNKKLTMEILVVLKNSLIIRSYPGDPDLPDATHIKSQEGWVLTGSSFKGAIRARAEKIVRTLDGPDEILETLFGYVDETPDNLKARKGKIRVEETILPSFIAEIQHRIKIDRFTGGTIKGALFDSMPIFQDQSGQKIKLNITIPDCNDAEAGLLLLVLKDIWTGDIAIGGEKNVGRGVFAGKRATINYHDDFYVIDENLDQLNDETKTALQAFVKALTDRSAS